MLDLFIIGHKLMYRDKGERAMPTKVWDFNPMFSRLLMAKHPG